MGYEVIPSQANFFMVGVKREVQGVIEDFRKKKFPLAARSRR